MYEPVTSCQQCANPEYTKPAHQPLRVSWIDSRQKIHCLFFGTHRGYLVIIITIIIIMTIIIIIRLRRENKSWFYYDSVHDYSHLSKMDLKVSQQYCVFTLAVWHQEKRAIFFWQILWFIIKVSGNDNFASLFSFTMKNEKKL